MPKGQSASIKSNKNRRCDSQ